MKHNAWESMESQKKQQRITLTKYLIFFLTTLTNDLDDAREDDELDQRETDYPLFMVPNLAMTLKNQIKKDVAPELITSTISLMKNDLDNLVNMLRNDLFGEQLSNEYNKYLLKVRNFTISLVRNEFDKNKAEKAILFPVCILPNVMIPDKYGWSRFIFQCICLSHEIVKQIQKLNEPYYDVFISHAALVQFNGNIQDLIKIRLKWTY